MARKALSCFCSSVRGIPSSSSSAPANTATNVSPSMSGSGGKLRIAWSTFPFPNTMAVPCM
eukprot:354577-Pyramimonas_sp.AAC.1